MNIHLLALHFQGFMKTQWHVSAQRGSITSASSLAHLLQVRKCIKAAVDPTIWVNS